MLHSKRASLAALLAAAVVLTAGCGGKAPGEKSENEGGNFSATTPEAAGDAGPITWAVYRATSSIDPIKAWDVPENMPVGAMCETLLTQNPDFTISPGLAESADYVDDTTLVLRLIRDATFWDGQPVTAEDVAYSLERARDPKLGGFYANSFSHVASIKATATDEVTIKLSEPDYWLRSILSAMPGSVIQKDFAEHAGDDFGTAEGGIMCSGPFKFTKWNSGGDVEVERNDEYWDRDAIAKVPSITFTPVSSDANLTAGFTAGNVDVTALAGTSIYRDLANNPDVTVTSGPSLVTDLIAIGDPTGPMGNLELRKALSMAIDRQTYIDSVYSGQAAIPRSTSAPGSWGVAQGTFESTLGKDPELTRDIEKAKELVSESGMEGATITMVTGAGFTTGQIMATVLKEAAEAIGLRLEQKTISMDKYNEIYFNPEARKGVDVFISINAPSAPDPGPFLADLATPKGLYNFTGWSNDKVTHLLDEARRTADDADRAELEAKADRIITENLPQIALAHPYNVLYTSSDLTGSPASYSILAGHFANRIGASSK